MTYTEQNKNKELLQQKYYLVTVSSDIIGGGASAWFYERLTRVLKPDTVQAW